MKNIPEEILEKMEKLDEELMNLKNNDKKLEIPDSKKLRASEDADYIEEILYAVLTKGINEMFIKR